MHITFHQLPLIQTANRHMTGSMKLSTLVRNGPKTWNTDKMALKSYSKCMIKLFALTLK